MSRNSLSLNPLFTSTCAFAMYTRCILSTDRIMTWTIGVDVGGTFTDFFALNEASGVIEVGKTPSTPDNPAIAVVSGLRDLAERHDIDLASVNRLSHGTTVGTNALIQRRGGKVVMLTTRGFRDLLEIGRQTRPHMFDLFKDHPPALVTRDHRFEVTERMDADGNVLSAPSRDEIDGLIGEIKAIDAESCAICFLFGFRNGSHEREVAAALREGGVEIELSLSSEVQPKFREYERFSTTVLNAYLQPVLNNYVLTLESEIAAATPAATLGINQSSGGLMTAERARALPVRTALSGPAAGAIGAIHVARSAAKPNVITLDMGGTSADVALIREYRADISFDRDVAGFPIRLPAVDIETVGAGGGSIAWFDRDGLLKVGPISAGADPGPACYDRGGKRPTVTDANLALGRLSEGGLLGGEMELVPVLAREAFAEVAAQLGFSVEKTAYGVLGIVVANMVRAIRTISVERGHDPRNFVLMPFGGAGPLHARDVAVSLGIEEILVPAAPGIVCAQGLVVSDLKEDFVVSQRIAVSPENQAALTDQIAGLFKEAQLWFERESITAAQQGLELSLDARYVGQNFELAVPITTGTTITAGALPDYHGLRERFFAVHEQAYGYFNPDDPIEVINFRLTARGRLYEGNESIDDAPTSGRPQPVGERDIFFEPDQATASQVYQRADLAGGHAIDGPAVIEQLDTTTLIYPGDHAMVDNVGNILISIRGG